MLQRLKQLFDREELLSGSFGIEREGLRLTEKGKLALTPHPEVFGEKMSNPYITTDFSESQMELITPNLSSSKKAYDYLEALYDIAVLNIGEEYLWPGSMPCDIPEDHNIPIASYGDCKMCQEARLYREELFKKYGGKKQLISGIHYNFSFEEQFIQRLFEHQSEEKNYKLFKDQIYLKVVRNYLRYRWLLIYLLGVAPVFHKSFAKGCTKHLEALSGESYSNENAISYRTSECGYKNHIDLYPDYSSVQSYVKSVEAFVESESIQSYKELYSQIRPKAKNNHQLLESLEKDGILYIEVRSIDNNPLCKTGIFEEDLEFLHLLMLYLLIKDEEGQDQDNAHWQAEANNNQRLISKQGLGKTILFRNGEAIEKTYWARELLKEMLTMDEVLGLGKRELINKQLEKVEYPELTYAYQVKELVKKEGYLQAHLNLAKTYKDEAYLHRYKLKGYEALELSTQILMKEAITRGIVTEVLDASDNFISLQRGSHIEYVKQATKTSKDSYMTMLMMENKTVTKKLLEKEGIYVPKGIEVEKEQNLELIAKRYEGKSIVVKPKSTNFGTGISIFPQGASREDLIKALEIGFQYDVTVLLEAFAKGKEYRFLVIGDEVCGILHRVPANVIGDGIHSISQLVEEKNKDSLRGRGYKTPLEKIKLDESSLLFLKQNGLSFESVPQKDEIVYLRENSNISTGGDSIDYTDAIPNYFKEIAIKAAKAVDAKFCGVDMMLENYNDDQSPYAIIELNFNPAIHIHSFPYKGKERNIALSILRVLGLN